MEQLFNSVPFSANLAVYIAIDISILIILLLFMRWLSGLMSKVSVSKELGERDNFAFGVSLAGRMIALAIVLSSVVGRHVELDFQTSLFKLLIFGLLGITLVRVGRFAHGAVSIVIVYSYIRTQIYGVQWRTEVSLQHNVGIACIEAVLAIGVAVILNQLLATALA